MRAGAVGLDPWRALEAVADDALITRALVDELEANEVAKTEAQARLSAVQIAEVLFGILEMFGYVERKRR